MSSCTLCTQCSVILTVTDHRHAEGVRVQISHVVQFLEVTAYGCFSCHLVRPLDVTLLLGSKLSLYRLCTLGYGVSSNPYKGESRVPEKFRSGLFRWTSYQAQLWSQDTSTTNTRPGGPPSLGGVHGSGTSSSRQTPLPWKTRQQRVLKLDTSRAYG